MAASWWKYGLCIFGGLGVGFAVGVRTAKNKAEKEKEEEIAEIREIYRNDRKAKAPKEKQKPEAEKPEVITKTSINMEKLSEKKKNATEALRRYSGKPEEPEAPAAEEEKEEEPEKQSNNMKDYIHVSKEEPEDCDYQEEILNYYSDGVVTRYPSDMRLDDNEITNLIGGEETLKLLDDDDCNQVYVVNDLYHLKYIIIFQYPTWAQKTDEEPYKKEL